MLPSRVIVWVFVSFMEIPVIAPVELKSAKLSVPLVEIVIGSKVELIEIAVLLV